jgi:hypothetical protein
MGVSENNGDGKVRSTGTTQTLLETELQSHGSNSKKKKCDVEGEGAANECTGQQWFKRFESGNLSLEDEQRPGLPRIWDSEATKEAAEQQPSTSMGRLSDTLGPSNSTIHCHIIALGNIYKNCRFVPHELTAELSQRRVEFCRKLLQLSKDHRFIKRIVTCDEKLIYLNNPDHKSNSLMNDNRQCRSQERALRKKGPPVRLGELRRSYLL